MKMEIIKHLPPEIWNHISFFTTSKEKELFHFLLLYQNKLKIRLDIKYLQRMFKRNLEEIRWKGAKILPEIKSVSDYIFYDYASLYPSSMISNSSIGFENGVYDLNAMEFRERNLSPSE